MVKIYNDIINEYWKFGAELGTAVENTSEEFDKFINTKCWDEETLKQKIIRTFNMVVPKHMQNDYQGLKIALLNELELD